MGRRERIIALLTVVMAAASPAVMRADDSGLTLSAGVEEKLSKKVSLEAVAELRSRNNFTTIDHFALGAGVKYKFTKWLKADAGYQVLINNNREHLTLHDDGSYNNWRQSYYGVRHRFTVSLTGDVDLGRFNVSLRERWQYTYRPEQSATRYDFDNEQMEPCVVKGKGKNVLRSRLKLDYNIPHCKFTPSVSAELYTTRSLEKTKFTVGGTYMLHKHHQFEAGYQYQLHNKSVTTSPDTHQIVLGYNYKF